MASFRIFAIAGSLRGRVPRKQIGKHLTVSLLLINIVICLAAFSFGFSVFGTIQAMDEFVKTFGEYNEHKHSYEFSSTNLALFNSFPLLLHTLGLGVGWFVGERWGRLVLFSGIQTVFLIGALVSYYAQTFLAILVGRSIVSVYVGALEFLVPVFQGELVPAAIRGALVSFWMLEFLFAALLSSSICLYTSTLEGDASWRIPVAIMFIFPSLVMLFGWLIPESPRWLIRQQRYDEAIQSLEYLYGGTPNYSAEREAMLLKEALVEADKVATGRWTDLAKGANKRRTLIALAAQFFSIMAGQSLSGHYGTVFLAQVGGINAFVGTVIKRAVVCLGPLTNIFMIERMGRRWIYIIWGSLVALAFYTMGGLACQTPLTQEYKLGIVSMIIFFPYGRGVSFGTMAPLMISEVPHPRLRDKTSLVSVAFSTIVDFLAVFITPYLLNEPYAGLGPKIGFIMGTFALAGVVWGYFCLPELKGRSLEEVEEIFESCVSARQMNHWRSTNVNSIGTRITRMEGGEVDTRGKLNRVQSSISTLEMHGGVGEKLESIIVHHEQRDIDL